MRVNVIVDDLELRADVFHQTLRNTYIAIFFVAATAATVAALYPMCGKYL